jgi:HEAT repeat protein
MVAAGNMFDLTPVSDTEHSTLLNKDIRFAALSRLAGPIALAALLALIFIIFRQSKRIRSLNRQ